MFLGLRQHPSGLCLCLHVAVFSLSLGPPFLQGGFLCGSAGKESTCNVGDLGLTPGLGRSPGEGKDSTLQYCGPESSMDCIVHGVSKSWTRLSAFHFLTRTPLITFWDPPSSMISTNYMCQDLIPKEVHTLRFWVDANPRCLPVGTSHAFLGLRVGVPLPVSSPSRGPVPSQLAEPSPGPGSFAWLCSRRHCPAEPLL